MHMYTFSGIEEGDTLQREYTLTEEVYKSFLDAFQDTSPLHVDETFARERGFAGRVMHGALLNGFVSHFVGVEYPGKYAMLQSVDIQYKNPNYLGDTIRLEAEVIQKVEALKVVIIKILLQNVTQQKIAATARAQVGMLE